MEKMKFFEFDEAIANEIANGTDEDGCITEEALERIKALELGRDAKIEGIALFMKDKLAYISALEQTAASEAERFKKEIEREKKQFQNLGKFMFDYLAGESWKSPTGKAKLSFRPKESVELTDKKAFIEWAKTNGHDNLLTVKTSITTDASKTAIKEAIDAGEEFPFARVVTNVNPQIK